MKEQILKLRAKGKSYNEIVSIVGCAKSTVAYHCNGTTKQTVKEYRNSNREHNLENQRQLREEKKSLLRRYKLMKGCAKCRYKENALALEFDHIDESKKNSNMSDLIDRGMKHIKTELKLCQVLCCNCHRIKTLS